MVRVEATSDIVYKVFITTLTYRPSHTCFRLYVACVSDFCTFCSVVNSGMDASVRRWVNAAAKRLTVGFTLHCIAVPQRFGNWMTFIIGRHAGVCVVVRPEQNWISQEPLY